MTWRLEVHGHLILADSTAEHGPAARPASSGAAGRGHRAHSDLRNPGASDQAVSVSDEFLDEGTIAGWAARCLRSHRGRDGGPATETTRSRERGQRLGVEIVTGAVQAHERGTAIGIPPSARGRCSTLRPERWLVDPGHHRVVVHAGRPADSGEGLPDTAADDPETEADEQLRQRGFLKERTDGRTRASSTLPRTGAPGTTTTRDTYEGLVAHGQRDQVHPRGKVNLRQAYVQIKDGEAWVYDMHISPTPVEATPTTSPCGRGGCSCTRTIAGCGPGRPEGTPSCPRGLPEARPG